MLKIIETKGREICPEFKITQENASYYLNLAYWFKGIYHQGGWDVNKGLLICGSVGTGKTLSMEVMRHITRNLKIVKTRHIIRDFFAANPPTSVIDQYGRHSYNKTPSGGLEINKPIIVCFDDFGLETLNAKSYGNDTPIMEEIILDRYDEFVSRGMKTIATTNLNVEMIAECYGERVKDRLKQMVTKVNLDGESKRK